MLLSHGASLGHNDPVLVPLCGKSNDMPWLHKQGLTVIGIKLADTAVRAFFSERGMTARHSARVAFDEFCAPGYRLLCGNYFALTRALLSAVDAIYDRTALIALPPAMRRDYAAKMTELTDPGTAMLLVTVDYDTRLISPPPFAVTADEVAMLYGDNWAIESRDTRDADVIGHAGSEQALLLTRR